MQGQKKLDGEELVSALKQQVEFYFSPQNLPTDVYLRSQMNARHFVSIETIASFRKVKALTENRSLLLKAMKQSRKLVLDETEKMVGPNLKVERTTLILRDMPSNINPDNIRKIFDNPNCGKVVMIRPDVKDTWFVTFENQEACTSTAMYLIGRTFQGKPIRCRVKSENPFRSLYWPNMTNLPPIPRPVIGQGRGAWKPGLPPPAPVFYSKLNFPPNLPYSQFASKMIHHHPEPPGHNQQPDRHRKSKRGNKKVYRGRQTQKQGDHQTSHDVRQSHAYANNSTTNHSKKVYIKYQQPCLKYTKQQMAEIVRKFCQEGYSKPKNLVKSGTSPVIADKPVLDSQLLEPMPVMYPSSPSPLFAAQAHHSSIPPFLDIASTVASNSGRGSTSGRGSAVPHRSEEKSKKARSKKLGPKKYTKKPRPRKTKKTKTPAAATHAAAPPNPSPIPVY